MVTDIDILVKLGYPRELSIRALAESKGDRAAALEYIRTGGQMDSEWRSYRPERDWRNNIAPSHLPRNPVMRALWKSPVTAHVNSFSSMPDGTIQFRCHVITHTKDWNVSRSLEDFQSFKSSLAFGTTLWFKQSMPSVWASNLSSGMSSIAGLTSLLSLAGMGEGEMERRRQMLDDWVRELTLSEQCMSCDALLRQTLAFFGEGEAGSGETDAAPPLPKPYSSSSSSTSASSTSSYPSSSSSSTSVNGGSSSSNSSSSGVFNGAAGLFDTTPCESSFVDLLKKIRTMKREAFPLSLAALDALLSQGPFKILVSDFPELASVITSSSSSGNSGNSSSSDSGSDESDTQLEKDLVRDRVVVNGKRHQGGELSPPSSASSSSSSSPSFLSTVVQSCSESIGDILRSPQLTHAPSSVPVSHPSVSPASVEAFSKSVLRAMSRTESAYLSLLCLSSIVDLSPPPPVAPGPAATGDGGDGVEAGGGKGGEDRGGWGGEIDMPMPSHVVPEAVLADPIVLFFQVPTHCIAMLALPSMLSRYVL